MKNYSIFCLLAPLYIFACYCIKPTHLECLCSVTKPVARLCKQRVASHQRWYKAWSWSARPSFVKQSKTKIWQSKVLLYTILAFVRSWLCKSKNVWQKCSTTKCVKKTFYNVSIHEILRVMLTKVHFVKLCYIFNFNFTQKSKKTYWKH